MYTNNSSYIFLRIYCALILVKICVTRSTTTTEEYNNPVGTTALQVQPEATSAKSSYERGLEDYDEAQARQSRGMMDYQYDHDPHHMMPEMKEEKAKAVKEDPWVGYYDFAINEGSFKFWAAFQLVTAALLIYSAFAAVYYAKFNVITSDYDYYDDFFGRSNRDESSSSSSSLWSGLSSQTFQRIFDALSSKKYS